MKHETETRSEQITFRIRPTIRKEAEKYLKRKKGWTIADIMEEAIVKLVRV